LTGFIWKLTDIKEVEQGPKQTPPPSGKSLVIQKRLEGKSMNQIVKETGISKGKVQYITKEWENKLGTSAAYEIIEFATLIKRSGITIEQCAQGFRMINILKIFWYNRKFGYF
jgi:hypothetical protein